jgi:hypothetical protein
MTVVIQREDREIVKNKLYHIEMIYRNIRTMLDVYGSVLILREDEIENSDLLTRANVYIEHISKQADNVINLQEEHGQIEKDMLDALFNRH